MAVTIQTTPPSSPASSLSASPRSEPPPGSPGTSACQALLSDEVTLCVGRASGRGRYCAEHGREYKALTRAYKEASEAVLVLDKLVRPLRTNILTLRDEAAIDEAVTVAERYLDAIEVEIEGRRRHHRRFFQTKDDGHEHWLKSLQTKKGAAAAFLERLRTRQRDLVTAKEAQRTFRESLRRIELAALEEPQNKTGIVVHLYGSGGQQKRVDWPEPTVTYPSIAPAPRAPVRPAQFRCPDLAWGTIDLEAQRQATGRRAMPSHEDAGGDSGGCGTLFWIVVGCVALCLWLG